MNRAISFSIYVAVFAALAVNAENMPKPPLKLIQIIPLPGIKHFEHFEADVKGNRLFSLSGIQEATLEVFDLRTGNRIRSIHGLEEGQCAVYREDVNRLYVVGGGGNLLTNQSGRVWIYDGEHYALIKRVDVPAGAAWCGYDVATKYLYVNGNGRLVQQPNSTVTVIDTTVGEEVARFTVDDDVITDFQLETSNPNIYTGERN